MPRRPEPIAPTPPPRVPEETPAEDATEGMLDLDDHDQINNQHLEVR